MSPTCLSAEPHEGEQINDPLFHYLGCLEFYERPQYLSSLNPAQQKAIEKERQRIERLRKVIRNEDTSHNRVRCIEKSLETWRKSPVYQNGRKGTREWRAGGDPSGVAKPNDVSQESVNMDCDNVEYNPASDLNAYLIQYQGTEPYNNDDSGTFHGSFPNHKTSMPQLLDVGDESNPLRRDKVPSGRMRYFHLPINNMHWTEKAIARYFGEEHTPCSMSSFKSDEMTRTQMLLRPQFWSGQQHGGREGAVHARHLRPLCETVSSDPRRLERFPKNVVLFMPYLHWDTDRKRERIARLVGQETENRRREMRLKEYNQKQERRRARKQLTLPNGSTFEMLNEKTARPSFPAGLGPPAWTFSSVVNAAVANGYKMLHATKATYDHQDRIVTMHPLGRVLFDAAMLYEHMLLYRDERIIKEYLHNDAPVHPRRTLDQAYYWTLKTTKSRDRDQVVYRGTTAKTDLSHRFNTKTKTWTCEEVEDITTTSNRCEQCRSDIIQVSRLVMVDQLWMWILDEHTIITSFPKRYGVKHGDSGVHKSIRRRLGESRNTQIRSVFDLALIIIDECSNTFFDPTKTQDRHPQVLVKFSEAISTITHKQSISFELLWVWTEKFTKQSNTKKMIDIQQFVGPLLDINPEGKLQREIKDVIDELDIMIHITKKQKEVIKKFKKHTVKILDPDNTLATQASTPTQVEQAEEHRQGTTDEVSRLEKFISFNHSAEDLLSELDDRLEELEGLKITATTTSSSLDHLMQLKQQQASVIQAWQSVKQSDAAMSQGRAIMIFTVFTIIFLPLSFMSSVWGMNNAQWTQSTMDLWFQVQLMIGIAAAVLVVTLPIAFSSLIREILFALWQIFFNWVILTTGIYTLWLDIDKNSDDIKKMADDTIQNMRGKVKTKRQARRAAEREANEKREADKKQKADNERKELNQRNSEHENGAARPGRELEVETTANGALPTLQQPAVSNDAHREVGLGAPTTTKRKFRFWERGFLTKRKHRNKTTSKVGV
ncbi:uncharacterized protein BCR38DRAFT_415455 [Pseudomassariella vexata]|uniref:Ankyrin repeat protein n=1 Tax=Pseudomassariella vexata TaxID=1141098 RepID=A0A1Y2EH72_9PEZI|nr:uncharacterized protein BCR38DRAFT_415455 [Pseudomassariella vexata]ORY70921.1 hypothetical protein BCR38DRAFT_415455 [Pseudomassariella vexata]